MANWFGHESLGVELLDSLLISEELPLGMKWDLAVEELFWLP